MISETNDVYLLPLADFFFLEGLYGILFLFIESLVTDLSLHTLI